METDCRCVDEGKRSRIESRIEVCDRHGRFFAIPARPASGRVLRTSAFKSGKRRDERPERSHHARRFSIDSTDSVPGDLGASAARPERTRSVSTVGSEKSEKEKDRIGGGYETTVGAVVACGRGGAVANESRRSDEIISRFLGRFPNKLFDSRSR